MNDRIKGTVLVLVPQEGESFWQPLPSTGYMINKFNPFAYSASLDDVEHCFAV